MKNRISNFIKEFIEDEWNISAKEKRSCVAPL